MPAPQPPPPDAVVKDPWERFRRTLTEFDRSKVNLARGLRNALGVALPLAAGALAGRLQPALVVATGALNVGFADSTEPYLPRLQRMLGSCALVSLAVFLGSLSGWTTPSAMAGSALWSFGAGMLVCLGTQMGNIGVSSTCVFLIFASRPLPLNEAVACGLLALGGGLLQTGLSVMFWAVHPYEPERRALAALYAGLARLTARSLAETKAPPGTAGANAAAEALAARQGDHSAGSERNRALLDQGERIRACLLTLRGLRARLDGKPDAGEAARLVDEFLAAAGRVLEADADMLRTEKGSAERAAGDSDLTAEPERILDAFRKLRADEMVLIGDTKVQMDALARQLRVTFDLAKHATPAGRRAFDRREAARSWRLRPWGMLGTLRANLSLGSTTFRHAVRLAVCVMAADALGRSLGWTRPYWLPLTVAVVLKPDFSSTFSRGALRLAGTFVGLGIATGLFHALPQSVPVEIALIMAVTFILRWSGPAHYGVLALCVSELVVLLVALTGVAPEQVIMARARNTALGGALALLAYTLWPSWERSQVGEVFARMLDAYRNNFGLLMQAFAGESPEMTEALERTRSACRLARTNLEASVDRLAAEPATTPAELDCWHAMMASSHIFAHSMIMLHASLLAAPDSLVSLGRNEAFQDFAKAVTATLERLAADERGAAGGSYPDLREAHYRLVTSGEPMAARHTLISVETDRAVNSLNTLREQIGCGRHASR